MRSAGVREKADRYDRPDRARSSSGDGVADQELNILVFRQAKSQWAVEVRVVRGQLEAQCRELGTGIVACGIDRHRIGMVDQDAEDRREQGRDADERYGRPRALADRRGDWLVGRVRAAEVELRRLLQVAAELLHPRPFEAELRAQLLALLLGALSFRYLAPAAERADWRSFLIAFAAAVALVLPLGTLEAVRSRQKRGAGAR